MKAFRIILLVTSIFVLVATATAQSGAPFLLRQPTVSQTHIVFRFADDLWIVPRTGGAAQRLTAGVGDESTPYFSPDGRWVAFTGNYDGNTDVFIVPATGGVPQRLTFHPGRDTVRGWTPDGLRVLFMSGRENYSRVSRLYTISVAGGNPERVPLPIALYGAYSPDGKKMAYDPRAGAYQTWKRYRGGRASVIWIANLSDSSVEEIPRENWNDFHPMWVGDKVYFLSDRDDYVTLYSYDTKTRQTKREIEHKGFDIKWASAGPGAIVYEQFGSLNLFDIGTGTPSPVSVQVQGDLPSVRPRFAAVNRSISAASLSPTGKRAAFEARGEILTVPAKKGDIRNLTNTSGAAERDPAWSPDGKWVAYFSDQSGEYQLHLRDQTGLGEVRKIDLGPNPSFYHSPAWSPDSQYIAFIDKALQLWVVKAEGGRPVRVDKTTYRAPFNNINPDWSPDSKWLVYTKQLQSYFHAVFVYNLETGVTRQITDGLSDARYAVFDRGGRHIFFTASTDIGPVKGWGEMSSLNRPVTRSVYVVVLRKEDPSPLEPESDEEEVKKKEEPDAGKKKSSEKPDAKKKEEVEVTIDFDGIDQRVLALPVPSQNISSLVAGKAGNFFFSAAAPGSGGPFGGGPQTVHKFDLESRKASEFLDGVSGFTLSADGEKLLYAKGRQWAIVDTAKPSKPGDGSLNLSGMQVRLEPRQEWRQIYREVWRIERDFLYDTNAHGFDLESAEKTYAPFLENLGSRTDLNYLISEMLGNLVLGHTRNGGGDLPRPDRVPGGLLGADYSIENGRYRFARIYRGENWNPQLRAPLTEPGVNVSEGDYLLEVNGRPVTGSDNVYRFFENTSGKQVTLKVGPKPDGTGAHEVSVVPVGSETTLRHRAWIDDNRRKVDEMTGGRVGYVYLPNTAGGGFTNFNRYYYAQTGKQAMVIDERFNGGGLFANWIVEQMKRPLVNFWDIRDSEPMVTPAAQVFGPKVMIINEFAGSGGDWMPWYFSRAGVGKLVGKRTWGGLVGIFGFPALIDGGSVTAPNLAFYTPEGEWLIENVGVPPDEDLEFDPKAWRAGRDPQLEKAVEIVLEELRQNPPKTYQRPAYPNYYQNHRQP